MPCIWNRSCAAFPSAFCAKTKLYRCNAARFRSIVSHVEARHVPPEKLAMPCGKNSAEKTAAFFLYAKPEPASFAVCSVAVTAPIFYHSQNPNLICLPATVFFKDTVCRLFYFIFLCFSKMNERNLEENGNFMGLFFLFILTDVRICDTIKQK